jgi:hypothetical protein
MYGEDFGASAAFPLLIRDELLNRDGSLQEVCRRSNGTASCGYQDIVYLDREFRVFGGGGELDPGVADGKSAARVIRAGTATLTSARATGLGHALRA